MGSGVDPNKSLADLSQDEKQKLCDSYKDYTAEKLSAELRCRADGIQAGIAALTELKDPEAPCQEAFDECTDKPVETISCDEEAIDNFPTCDTRVGVLEDCGTDTVDSISGRLEALPTCDKLEEFLKSRDQDDIDELRAPFETPESCDKLPDDCNFAPVN
jgi:hypothetical protein